MKQVAIRGASWQTKCLFNKCGSSQRQLARSFSLFAVALLLLPLYGCAVGDDSSDDDNGDSSSEDSIFSMGAETNEEGIASISFSVPNGTSKLAVTAEANRVFLSFDSLTDSAGRDFLTPANEQISLSIFPWSTVNTAVAPVRDVDPRLENGQTYLASIAAGVLQGDSLVARAGIPVTFTMNTKVDGDLRSGSLRLNVVYVGDIGQSNAAVSAVSEALQIMRSIYAERAQISVRLEEWDMEGPASVPPPFRGSDFYLAASSDLPTPAVNVFIAGDIDDSGGEVLGVAGGIPGPPNPSTRSAVAVSTIAGAGADGVYSDADLRILGETIAHEVAHYTGLEHPVEFDGNGVADVDALGDTPVCSFLAECMANDALAQNFMFPFPVANGSGGFVPQQNITSEQRSAMNRYIVVD